MDTENNAISVSKQLVQNPDSSLELTHSKTETSIRHSLFLFPYGSGCGAKMILPFEPQLFMRFYSRIQSKTP